MKKNKIWKLAAFAVMFVLGLVATIKLSTTAEATAGAISPDNITVDYVNETVTVEVTGANPDTIIYYTDSYNKDVSKWDACEVREVKDARGNTIQAAVFDISWINEKKTVRLYVCGDVNKEVVSVDVTWQEDFNVKFTGTLLTTDITEAETWKEVYEQYDKFDESTGYFVFTLNENGRDMSYFPNKSLDTIQWRKGDDGVWRDFDELDLKEMNIRGIKLQFRIIANENERASSIASVSVSKLSSAPKVSVNPDTMTVSVKNCMEFSFDKENWIMIPEYNKKYGTADYFIDKNERDTAIEEIYTTERVTSMVIQKLLQTQDASFTMNTPMDQASLEQNFAGKFEFTDEGIVLYVRDIGTGRKAASKIAEVIIPYSAADKAKADEDALKFSYGESKTNTGGIVVENTSADKYQVGVITKEEWDKITDDQNIDLSEIKWTSIKEGKMLKISNKKVPKDSMLIYRIAGENDMLPSTYELYGPMKYNELTYAGMAKDKMRAGETVEAVVSTNLKTDDPSLEYQWQCCEDIKAAEPVWEDIAGATDATYELTNDEANKYIRVRITNTVTVGSSTSEKEIIMYSDPEGPVKYVAPVEEPTPSPTPTPTPTP